jgi:hypothetical protein
MSEVTIAPGRVVAVLLADGWHQVARGSFSIGTLAGEVDAGVGTPSFRFEEASTGSPYGPAVLVGPLGSILAVRQVNGTATRRPAEPFRPPGGRRTWTAVTPVA